MSKKNDKKPDIRSFFAATKKKIRYDNVSSSKLTPSSSSSEKIRKSKEKQPKQVTIESLGRVVVIEEFERCKGILKEESASKDRVLEALNSMKKKQPSREVIKNTGLGLILNNMRNHEDEEIKTLASAIYRQWKTFLKNHAEKKSIEVKSDKKTEEMRTNGRNLIIKVFNEATIDEETEKTEIEGLKEFNISLAQQIEREVLKCNKRLISKPYRRHMRRIAMAMKNDMEMVSKVISGQIDPGELADQTSAAKNNSGEIGKLLFNENKLDGR